MTLPVILGNWKMHGSEAMVEALGTEIQPPDNIVCGVAVPALFLEKAVNRLAGWQVGAQDVSEHQQGAYTGCVSAQMLRQLGCNFCLVGHSERRAYQHEQDAQIALKIERLNEQHIVPVLCVGEDLTQREANETLNVVSTQLRACLPSLAKATAAYIAYEPIWAIGTGKTATAEQAQEVHSAIRKVLQDAGEGLASTKILYGGSVNAGNIASLLAQPDIDGALVGGASLTPESWHDMINNII